MKEDPQISYVYRHIRRDIDQPFYVGVGTEKLGKTSEKTRFHRAYSKDRNNFWKAIVAQTDYDVEIIHFGLTREEALEKEKYWIAEYGRRNIDCTKSLCNLTDGGDKGVFNKRISEETRKKLRETQDIISATSFALLDPDNNLIIGRNLSQFSRDNNLSLSCMRQLLARQMRSHKGYSPAHPDYRITEIEKIGFSIKNSKGEIFSGSDLRLWCKQNDLRFQDFKKLINGIRQIAHGYVLKDSDYFETPKILYSPNGEKFKFFNITQFAKEHNLEDSYLSLVLNGKLVHSRGWHLPNPSFENQKVLDRYNGLKNRFIILQDNKIHHIIQLDKFAEKHGTSPASIKKFLAGTFQKHFSKKGWRIPSDEDFKNLEMVEN